MQLAKKGQSLTERMSDGVYTAPASNEGVQGGAKAVQFRKKFDTRDRYDDEMNQKMQLMDKNGMTPFGQVYYDDKVGRWLEKKEAAAEAANFDAYFNREFNVNDLAGRQWAQSINPGFYDSREQEMNDKAELVVKIKKIQLRGPQNEEDLKILYLIEQGHVRLPDDWDRIGPGFHGTKFKKDDKKDNQQNFRRGLIRMPLFLSKDQKKEAAKQNMDEGAWGNYSAPMFAKKNYKVDDNYPLAKKDPSIARNFVKWLGQ